MRRRFLLVVAIAVVLASTGTATATSATSTTSATGSYIVVFKNTVADPGAVATAQGRAQGFQARFVYRHALKGYAASLSPAAVSAIAADRTVAYVAADETFQSAACPGPPFSPPSSQQCLPNWADRIDTEQSSSLAGDGMGSVNVNVAVVDSGIDLTHPDLNVVGGVNCVGGKGFGDDFGHGSGVAGILGARDNAIGLVGVAPGANLWSVRVLNKNGSGSESQILCGIDWVTSTRTDSDPANNIAVANMSIVAKGSDDGKCGNTPKRDALHQAICASVAAGVTYVVAAGNDGKDYQNTRPAAYHEVLTATAIDNTDSEPGGLGPPSSCVPGNFDDTAATFSNFATLPADQAHTLAAPGICDATTYLRDGYAAFTGTSAASPAVAGTVALCIASGPCAGLTPAQIIQKMVTDTQAYNTANPGYGFVGDPIRPVTGKYYGYLIHAGGY